jgi:putative phosphoribosyl transferase
MFADRREAGRRLAALLAPLAEQRPTVLALPRGGVPIGFEVATALRAPLDVLVVRKLGVPTRRELAMGAIGEGGGMVADPYIVRQCDVTTAQFDDVVEREQRTVDEQIRRYRGDHAPAATSDRTAIIVDDGLATGATARAACQIARTREPRRVIVAVPVGPAETVAALSDVCDEVICVETPPGFYAVGQWYRDFSQVSDEDVARLLDSAANFPSE